MKIGAILFALLCFATQAQQPMPHQSAPSSAAQTKKPQATMAMPETAVEWSKPVGPLKALSQAEFDSMMAALAKSSTEEKVPVKLGPVDSWRYRRCQEEAAKAPTSLGVNHGLRLCRERFDQ